MPKKGNFREKELDYVRPELSHLNESWVGRLEIAREVDSRITKIYADLVSLEKMMHYKRSIIDVLKDILPSIDADQGRRRTLIEECYERWRENADPNRGNGEDNENEN